MVQLSTMPNILPRLAKPQHTTEVLPVSSQEFSPCLGGKVPNNMTYIGSPQSASLCTLYSTSYPSSKCAWTSAQICSSRNNTLAAVTLNIASPGWGFYGWLDPGYETEQLRWIFGSERSRFVLLFLAADLSSGPKELGGAWWATDIWLRKIS